MLMTNANVRISWNDKLLNFVLIRFLPRWLQPNHVTIFRFLMIPFVLFYVTEGDWDVAVPLFLFAAFTDALDGSMARIRKQITIWGTIADPVADKLLIGSVVVLFVAREVNMTFATIIVFMEILIAISGLVRSRRGEITSANVYGKLKMVLQVLGVVSLLIARESGISLMVPFSVGTLSVAVVFAVISLFTYGF